MTSEELEQLHRRFRRYRKPEDGDRLLNFHRGFAVQIARRHVGPHITFEEAEGAALRGLYEALKRHDPEEGAFTTFAYWWVFKMITLERAFLKNVVRIPTKVLRQSRRVQRLIAEGRSNLHIAEEMGIEVDQIKGLAELHLLPTGTYYDPIESDHPQTKADEKNGADLAERDSQMNQLEQAMSKLDERARDVVRSRHCSEPASFLALSKKYGVTRQRIQDIYVAAIKKLRWHCRKT